MAQVTLIFDEFGHITQPYWLSWYQSLKNDGSINFDVLASKISSDQFYEVKLLKPSKSEDKALNWIRLLLGGEKPNINKAIYRNVLGIDSPLIHLLKAQMYPGLSQFLPAKSSLLFSFRGYDTLVYPFSNKAWMNNLLNIYGIAKGLHFVSDYIKNQAISLGAPPEKCKTIYRPVNTDFFMPTQRLAEKEKLNILSVGRLTWQKGYIDALKAVSIVAQKGYPFHYNIIGEGADIDHIMFHLRRLNLEHSTTILPYQNRANLKQYYQNADIFLITSLTDALPNVVLEASAMSLPIVATNVAGIPEAVLNEISGLLVPPCDPVGIAQAIEYLTTNPDKRFKMGVSGRAYVSERFSPLTITKQWIEYYQKLI